jgi:TPR repeat protein
VGGRFGIFGPRIGRWWLAVPLIVIGLTVIGCPNTGFMQVDPDWSPCTNGWAACQRRGDDTCADIPKCWETGFPGQAARPQLAVSIFDKRCASGSADDCMELGRLLLYGHGYVPADPARAGGYGERACALDVNYCKELEHWYDENTPLFEPTKAARPHARWCAVEWTSECADLSDAATADVAD